MCTAAAIRWIALGAAFGSWEGQVGHEAGRFATAADVYRMFIYGISSVYCTQICEDPLGKHALPFLVCTTAHDARANQCFGGTATAEARRVGRG